MAVVGLSGSDHSDRNSGVYGPLGNYGRAGRSCLIRPDVMIYQLNNSEPLIYYFSLLFISLRYLRLPHVACLSLCLSQAA
jgi:hypothetical protein